MTDHARRETALEHGWHTYGETRPVLPGAHEAYEIGFHDGWNNAEREQRPEPPPRAGKPPAVTTKQIERAADMMWHQLLAAGIERPRRGHIADLRDQDATAVLAAAALDDTNRDAALMRHALRQALNNIGIEVEK